MMRGPADGFLEGRHKQSSLHQGLRGLNILTALGRHRPSLLFAGSILAYCNAFACRVLASRR